MATDRQRQALRRGLVRLVAGMAVVLALLFVPAGSWAWPPGWLCLAALALGLGAGLLVLWRANPDIFVARDRIQPGTKGWDYVFLALVFGGFIAVPVVAGLDFRFGWTRAPGWLVAAGYVLFAAGFVGQVWPQAVNRHFEPGVRIQSDRRHRVVDTGPYALVRHPGYVGGSLFAVGLALALGSLAALLPAAAVVAALLLRTVVEDQTLQRELPGYAEYALRVRFRWLPGVW